MNMTNTTMHDLTHNSDPIDCLQALNVGMDGFIPKPMTIALFRDVLKTV